MNYSEISSIKPFALTSPVPIVSKVTKKANEQLKHDARLERQRLKAEQKQLEKEQAQRPPTVLTVNHMPTYTCLSYRRLDGLSNNRNAPQAFISKSEIQSQKSQTRLKNALNWMLLFADKKRVYSKKGYFNSKTEKVTHNFYFRLAFITLTLPSRQSHSDDYIKEHMLQSFLYWLTRYYNCLYVWKAEAQLNGNIHFHITIDSFVPWKSIRAKWNKILSKHNYCKVLQDGSNDHGDAATQIKAVCNEKKCVNDIGGYMSKKDQIKKKQLTELLKFNPDYAGSMVHCKFNPQLSPESQDRHWYKRVIDGRLWGCSGVTYKKKDGKFILYNKKRVIDKHGLSNIKVFIDELSTDFMKEEKIFFRQNPNILNLGTHVIEREKLKYKNVEECERQVRGITDDDIEKKYRFMKNVFIHKHLSMMKKGSTLQKLIHNEKLLRKHNFQTFFTDN